MCNEVKIEEFLLKEYDAASQLTYHIDELRAKLTNFYVTFSGIAGAGLLMLIKGEAGQSTGFAPVEVVSVLMAFVGVIGAIITFIIARLRRVQLEHFRIINNIRAHFLKHYVALWNVVELSACTLPVPSRKSGSYMWVLLIMIISSFFLAFSISNYLHLVIELFSATTMKWLSIVIFVIFVVVLDRLYMFLAVPTARRNYTDSDLVKMNVG